jgi:AraC-like DNA-binding protein
MERYLSIEEVAGRCGFRDSFYFSTAFKKQEGIPPREYRKLADAEQAE